MTLPSSMRAVADWLLGISPGEPEPIRAARIGSMFQKRPALVLSSLAILLASGTTAAVTGKAWAYAWVGCDLFLLVARFYLSFRHDRPGVQVSIAGTRLIAFGSCILFVLLGLGCSMAMSTGIPLLMVMSAISIMGLSNGITSLWAGVPRLALVMLGVTATPFLIAMAFGAGLPLVALQFAILLLGTSAFVVQNNANLMTMLRAEHHNRRLAGTDHLTGLASRGALLDRLRKLCAAGDSFSLLYLDLDGFKAVNDTFGHIAGDELLRVQARRIAKVVGEQGCACRFGGDEFVLLLDSGGRDCATHGGEVLIAAIAEPVTLPCGSSVRVSASIGVALSPGDSADPDTLIAQADKALYAAKADGKATYRFFDSIPRPA